MMSNSELTNGIGKWVFWGIVIVILKLTNPTVRDHKSEINRIINSELSNNEQSENLLNVIFSEFGNYFIRSLANEMISINDYFILSTTILEYEGVANTVGIGVLGNVFIFPSAEQKMRGLIRENVINNSLELPPIIEENQESEEEWEELKGVDSTEF